MPRRRHFELNDSPGLSQPSALSLVRQRQLGAGKEQPAIEDGLEQASLAGRADGGKDLIEVKARPSVVEDSQSTVVQGLMKLNLIGGEEVLTLERSDDDIASGSGQFGDVADGARAGPVWSAKGLAHEVGDVGFAVFAGGSGSLHEHGLHDIVAVPTSQCEFWKTIILLLATHFSEIQAKLRFWIISLGT